MDLIYLFILIILILCLMVYFKGKSQEVDYVTSKVDGRRYLVANLSDKQDAADLLAQIRKNLIDICKTLEKKYPDREDIKRMNEKFDPDVITEKEPKTEGTSYSINKGEKIVLCLRSRGDDDQLVDINIMMFVSLHELAHIMTKSVGHTTEFWNNFKFLLSEAIKMGLYKDVDFKNNPANYCGIKITDSPLHQ